jgi:hypothetical protein
MAGFLVIGLSIPHAFGAPGTHGSDGLALGLGYLVVVCVHSALYLRVNENIWRILPFNLTSPVLVIIAGLTRPRPRTRCGAPRSPSRSLGPWSCGLTAGSISGRRTSSSGMAR